MLAAAFLAVPHSLAAEIKLARHPDYHHGKIVFSYQGDLWSANEDGSNPRRLTVHRAADIHPRFSPDGKWIAFSSARYGNHDVFVIPAEGGTPRQLTFHSAADIVVGWSRDSRRIIFQSARGRLYPGIPNLYEVPLTGGLEEPLPTDWGYWASYSPDGRKLAFNRHPMVWWRKHYRGSYAADLWVLDLEKNSYRKLLDADLPDDQKPNNFWPMYANGEIYFVSDRAVMAKAGSKEVMKSVNNIWKVSEYGGPPVQVTRHTSGSLFWPSMSADGKVIVYEENFGLWKLDVATGRTTAIKIDLITDEPENSRETLTINGEADSYHLSPSGKRAVISVHGELFTIATDRGDVRRVTRTPGARDTQPRWSPDGKWIAFISDRSGREEVWVCDEQGGQLRQISDSDTQKGQFVWSPDSKALLYTASDKKLYKYSFATDQTTALASGTVISFGGSAIGNPQWSPDGKWISYHKASDTLLSHVYVIPADGGAERRLTDDDVYSDSNAVWTPDGKRIVYLAGGDVSNIGQAGRSTAQLFVVSLLPEEKDPADRNIDSEEEAAAAERQGRGLPRRFGGSADNDEPARGQDVRPAGTVEVKIDFNRIGRRARQLTRIADNITSLAVSPDSRSVVFATVGTEGGRPVQSIWSVGIDGERLTRVTQSVRPTEEGDGPPAGRFGFGGLSSLQFARDGRTLYFRQGNGIYAVAVGGGLGGPAAAGSTPTPPTPRPGGRGTSAEAGPGSGSTARRINFTVRVEVDHRAERKQVFNESWRVMKHRFYDPAMHGVDWDKVRAIYEPLLEHVGDQEGLHNVVSMMLGELNASHTGISGGGRGERGEGRSPQTRFPGFELEADRSGYYKVSHIYKNGPADKDWVKINVGDYILAVDGDDLKVPDNYWRLFTAAPGSRMEFLVNSKPTKEGAWKTRVTPVSSLQQTNLQYEKWVADRRAMVEKLSGGEIGYLHIRQMNETALRQFERDLTMLRTKKALIIDQRFNPGGSIDQELLQILGQRQYQYTRVRDSIEVTRPLRGFFGPMVVMANERSTSDAEVFPDGFRTLKLGKVVGVTTYGAVIGTGSYQLMDGSSIRTPSSGLWNVNGTNLENYGVPPDVYVDNTPEDFCQGRDAQLERAVEVLKEELRNRPKPPVLRGQ
ncbi:MAG TPA: S41 family peptidase [Gemmataceae bacterium]|nr:S41 family peptidase [Gemmataceae bacterium]